MTGGELRPIGLSRAAINVRIPDTAYFDTVLALDFERGGEGAVTVTDGDGSAAAAEYQPTAGEAEAIKAYLATVNWPKSEFINPDAAGIPPLWKNANKADRWVFRDKDNEIVMLQVKTVKKGEKAYVPITFWSDGEYRYAEPDVRPFYNDHLVSAHRPSVVFIHEGAKAAQAGQAIADDDKSQHAWKRELSGAVHIGLIGGAASMHKTDLSSLKRRGVRTIYVVPDNDKVGLRGANKVAKALDGTVHQVRVGDDFPTSWDMADDMPAKFFKNGRWVGPTFASTVFPATQATRAYVDENGKTRFALRQEFADQWLFATETGEFIHRLFPELQKTNDDFNNFVAPWSAVDDTARLVKREGSCQIEGAVYRPGVAVGGVLTEKNKRRLFNVWRPNDLPAIDGDISRWVEFLDYLLPDETERDEFERWFYTLIGSPQTRMHYSCLMYSEQTGTGKSICGSVLYQIIGQRNAVIANPAALDSAFNSHFENRQLVIFNELYEGGSNFKTTNALKTVQTDEFIRINAKYRHEKTVENHTHIFAASNSEHALDIDDHDRRWLIVQTTDTPWPKEKFAQLVEWLFDDIGCNVILAAAHKFSDYVKKGERAPTTEAKRTTIFHTKSDVVLNLEAFDEAYRDDAVAVEIGMFQAFVTGGKNVPKSDSVTVNSQRIKKLGWGVLNQRDTEFDGYRPSIGGKPSVIVVSPALKTKMLEQQRDDWIGLIKPALVNPYDSRPM
ncbi:hypothetical protein VW23_027445 [Devosia insulae DS-56]|uniref:NrS-1 polymerase-like helicase domain-containing protein n=2 Tax=Devosia insulae TaxID=408174 RepID=A0A1E5XK53_9HYPH|nr:hypothetical protein VW23_027445 [Devosia insulae DS-56]